MNSTTETENSKRDSAPKFKILLIEDNPGDARLIKETLEEAIPAQFEITNVQRLAGALKRLKVEKFDVILLDLMLPDGTGLDTFIMAYAQSPEVPIIVLTGLDSEELAAQAMRRGAQDYLVKGQIDGNLLARSIRYAVERHQLQLEIRSLSLVDDLTGLYNRRGFLTLAEQHLKLAHRMNKEFLLAFADLDGLKEINDTFGHHEGDSALKKTAEILKETFRSSDIIARIGGDEFAIVLTESRKESAEIIAVRLQTNIEACNMKEGLKYKISVSIGVVCYDCQSPCSIDELLGKADKLMYTHKQSKKNSLKNSRESEE